MGHKILPYFARKLRLWSAKVKRAMPQTAVSPSTSQRRERTERGRNFSALPPDNGAIMPKFTVALALTALIALSACKEDKPACTEDLAKVKLGELTTKMQEVATKDPAKLAALAPKLQDIQAKLTAAGNEPQAACDALDEIMTELSK